jgi:hypothetical protein
VNKYTTAFMQCEFCKYSTNQNCPGSLAVVLSKPYNISIFIYIDYTISYEDLYYDGELLNRSQMVVKRTYKAFGIRK